MKRTMQTEENPISKKSIKVTHSKQFRSLPLSKILSFLSPEEVLVTWSMISKNITAQVNKDEFWIPFIKTKFGSIKGLLYHRFHVGFLLYGYKTNQVGKVLRTSYVKFLNSKSEVIKTIRERNSIYTTDLGFVDGDPVAIDSISDEDLTGSQHPINEFRAFIDDPEEPEDSYGFAHFVVKKKIPVSQDFRNRALTQTCFKPRASDAFDFHDDVLRHILSFLTIDDLTIVGQVNVNWHSIVNNDQFLFARLLNHYGSVRKTCLFPKIVFSEVINFNTNENHVRDSFFGEGKREVMEFLTERMGSELGIDEPNNSDPESGEEEEDMFPTMDSIIESLSFVESQTNPILLSEHPAYNVEDDLAGEIFVFRDTLDSFEMDFDDYSLNFKLGKFNGKLKK
jgi:hypothetical protein